MNTTSALLADGYGARREGRAMESREIFARVTEIFRSEGDQAGLAEALCGVAQAESDLGDAEGARRGYAEAVGINRVLGDRVRQAYALRHLGDVLRKCGQFEAAAASSVEALGLYREGLGTKLDVANALRGLALARESEGARELWMEAREIYAELGIEPGVAECDRWLA